jgi:hypothetical protein
MDFSFRKIEMNLKRFPILALPSTTSKCAIVAVLLITTAASAQKPAKLITDLLGLPTPPRPTAKPQAMEGEGKERATSVTAAAPALVQHKADTRYNISEDGAEVSDTQTGLIWRRCAEGMNWSGTTCAGEAAALTSLQRVLVHAKAEAGAAKAAWRVPTVDELKSITNIHRDDSQGIPGAAGSDAIAFPAIPLRAFWSATLYYKERGDRDRTKIIHFATGQEHFLDNGETGSLRLVRNAPGNNKSTQASEPIPLEKVLGNRDVSPDARYAISANGQEVKDNKTGLIWRRCAEGMTAKSGTCTGKAAAFSFDDAQKRAVTQAKSSAVAWRAPSAIELRSIADESRFKLAIDTAAFPATPPNNFWTSIREGADYGKTVNFYNGFGYSEYHTASHHLRLVRDGN